MDFIPEIPDSHNPFYSLSSLFQVFGMITSSASMKMVGGTSLRMSPNKSQRHNNNLKSDFKRQMCIKRAAQQRYQKEQLNLSRTMRQNIRKRSILKNRQRLIANQKITRQKSRFMQRPASASVGSKRSSTAVHVHRSSNYVNQINIHNSSHSSHHARQRRRPQRPSSAQPGRRQRNFATQHSQHSQQQQRHTHLQQRTGNVLVDHRNRSRSNNGGRHQRTNVNWQIVGASVVSTYQQKYNQPSKQRQRPMSAGNKRSDPQRSMFTSPHSASYVYAPTIIRAVRSPRVSVRSPSRARTATKSKLKRPKSADQRNRQTRHLIQNRTLSRGRPQSAGRRREVQHATNPMTYTKIHIPTGPTTLTTTIDMPNTMMEMLSKPEDQLSATIPTPRATTTAALNVSTTPSVPLPTSPISPTSPTSSMHKATKVPKWEMKPQYKIPAAPTNEQKLSKNMNNIKQHFDSVQYSVLTSFCQQVGGTRKWHVTAIEFLSYCQTKLNISSMTLEEAQMLCCNEEFGGVNGYENIFNARSYVTVIGSSTAKKGRKHGKDTIKSSAVANAEISKGPNAFSLEYGDFRARFWEPIDNNIKQVFKKLSKEVKTPRKKKDKKGVVATTAETATHLIGATTWVPKIEHWDDVVDGMEKHYLKNNEFDMEYICREHIQKARRMKRLYNSIRKSLKKINLSCATAFSSFQLSMDPIVSLDHLRKAAVMSAKQVLTSPSLHMKAFEFVNGLCGLAESFMKSIAYDSRSRLRRITLWKDKKGSGGNGGGGKKKFSGVATVSGTIDLLETKSFLQWVCMNRFDNVANVVL